MGVVLRWESSAFLSVAVMYVRCIPSADSAGGDRSLSPAGGPSCEERRVGVALAVG